MWQIRLNPKVTNCDRKALLILIRCIILKSLDSIKLHRYFRKKNVDEKRLSVGHSHVREISVFPKVHFRKHRVFPVCLKEKLVYLSLTFQAHCDADVVKLNYRDCIRTVNQSDFSQI